MAYRSERLQPGSVPCFFVDDYKFEHLWTRPEAAVNRFRSAGVTTLVMPDFSMDGDQPYIARMFNLYRSRWLARYWQEQGLTVIPSLCWCRQSWRWLTTGLPPHNVLALECRPLRGAEDRALKALAVVQSRLQPTLVLLYGASERFAQQSAQVTTVQAYSSWRPPGRNNGGA